jgi:hypothetical protein
MVSELETKLRQLAKNGELCYLSMVTVAGKGEYGVTFVAQVTPASRFGYVEGRDSDPVKALLNALDALPKSFVKETPRERRTRDTREALAARDTAKVKVTKPWDLV